MPNPRRVASNVLVVKTSHRGRSRTRSVKRATGLVSVTLIVAAMIGVIGVVPSGTSSAIAAPPAGSAITVAWAGDVSLAQSFQPERVMSSPHYSDFDDLTVSVSQTSGIVDQTVRVTIAGFSPTISATQSRDGFDADNGQNFIQAMQCWGPDPNAENFNETCQWGGRVDGTGVGNSVIADNLGRVGPLDLDFANPTVHDVKFVTASGREVSGKPRRGDDGRASYDMLTYFSPSTTNEVAAARIGADGTGFFDFETQSADTAPHLGCGAAANVRCWLVIVPRGTHFGGNGAECSGIRANQDPYGLFTRGQANVIQGGSPVNDQCDYFANRVVVPLDFRPTGASCAIGGTETRIIGSQLMAAAMSSWQPSLCTTVNSTFNFSTNPDVLARSQLIATSTTSPNIAYSGFPVNAGELTTEDQRTALANSSLAYVPVAVSAMVVGFVAESASGRQESLVISPRLMAKYLTQSYSFLVPQAISSQGRNATHLGEVNRGYRLPFQDPEFQLLNPSNFLQFQYVPSVVLPASRADGIKQVWRWILADADARAFLSGTADPWGMTVNPYYLPAGTATTTIPWYLDENARYLEAETTKTVGLSNLDGTPRRLIDSPADDFSKSDKTTMPLQLATERSRFDSIQFAPYADTFFGGARQAFRAESRARTLWDPNALNAIGEPGDWKSTGAQIPGQRFMITVTDSVSALRWGISTARLTAPGSTITAATAPASIETVAMTAESMTSSLLALEATSLDSVTQVNPANVAATAWPMTMVTYAGVNLTKATDTARDTIAAMLTQVTTTGQVPGTAPGQLPAGYLPLTTQMQQMAAAGIATITSFGAKPAEVAIVAQPSGIAQDLVEAVVVPEVAGAGVEVAVVTRARTASSTEPLLQSGLAIALFAGLVGLLVAPVLIRGRLF